MTRRLLLLSLLALTALSCATADPTPGEPMPGRSRYAGRAGESPVGVIPEATVRGGAGSRDLLMSVDYPTRTGSHPLLVFFHAAGASHRDYIGLSSVWASHGYVVVKPHAAASIAEVLDNLDRLEQAYPELQGKIDRTKIGVAGHGAGALTAIRAAADTRVAGIVAMQPDVTAEAREAIAALTRPALFLTGARDPQATEPDAFAIAPAGDKWLIELEGASPSTFRGTMHTAEAPPDRRPQREGIYEPRRDPYDPNVDIDGRREPRESAAGLRLRASFNTVKGLSLAFWDAYLRAEGEGREALEEASGRRNVTSERK